MSEEHGFKGVWMTATLWLNKELNWTEKALIAEIDCLCHQDSPCFASIDGLAERINTSTSRTADLLSELTRNKHLIQLGSDGRRVWRCAAPQYWQDPGMVQKWENRFIEKTKSGFLSSGNGSSQIQDTELPKELPKESLRSSNVLSEHQKNSDSDFFSKERQKKKLKLSVDLVLGSVPPDLTLQSPSFLKAWKAWVENRLQLRNPTLGSFEEHMRICTRLGEARAISAIRHSIASSYLTIYEPKSNYRPDNNRDRIGASL
jgi:hypothetical protein